MKELLIHSGIIFWISFITLSVLILALLTAFIMSKTKTFTRAVAVGCSGEGCSIYRIRRPRFMRTFDFLFRTRAYSCTTCQKDFLRFMTKEQKKRERERTESQKAAARSKQIDTKSAN
jgi:hypothetical protein